MNKHLKNILKNGEEKYDPQAWKNLSKRLDATMPIKKTISTSTKTVIVATTSVIIIGSISLFFYNNRNDDFTETDSKKTRPSISQEADQEKLPELEKTTKNKLPSSESIVRLRTKSSLIEKQEVQSFKSQEDNKFTSIVYNKNLHTEDHKIESFGVSDERKNLEKINIAETESHFIAPKFDRFYCIYEEITIENKNQQTFDLVYENMDLLSRVPANGQVKIKLNKAGTYSIRHGIKNKNNQVEEAFRVYPLKEVSFSYEDEINYDHGIPFIVLKANLFADEKTSWSCSKGKILNQGEISKLFVFRKGVYDVVLSMIDENGCTSKKTQQITIKEEYNLLAPTAFIPSDIDPRNNKFIPFALTQRNVAFDMVILDPENGRIVFKTNSAENAWDGIDMNTGQLVNANKAFIWRVILKNPEVGEKNEYSGTIVRM